MKVMEFYFSPDGEAIIVSTNGKHFILAPESGEIILHIYQILELKYPDAFKRLNELYCNERNFMYLVVTRFIKCNWGKSDEKPDIIGNDWHLEKVHCPLRGGFCADENVICLPRLSTNLTARELEIVKLAHLPVKEIAIRLYRSEHTVENHLASISRKLNVSGKSEIVNYAHNHKLV